MEYKNKQKILLSHVLLLSFLVFLCERTLIFIFKLKKGKSQQNYIMLYFSTYCHPSYILHIKSGNSLPSTTFNVIYTYIFIII